ncbi:MAG TPA: hypothetical protein VFT58_06490, partial [Nitrososphaera sp.]|nr:hypothetical protein [Nitrososphaera sp.]
MFCEVFMIAHPSRGRAPRPDEPPKSFRTRVKEARAAFGNIPGAFRLVWGADKRSTVVMGALTLVSAGLPASQAWAGALIVDSVVRSLNQKLVPVDGLRSALPYVLLEFGL